MGVRLYPSLAEGVTLNQVIGISDAEYQRWKELKAKITNTEAFYELIYSEGYEQVLTLNNFDLNGWGKFECLESMKDVDGS